MDLQLKDKKVLITGATQGIGFGSAREFISAGAEVWLHGSTIISCNRAIEKLHVEYPSAILHACPCDFFDEKAVIDWISQLPAFDILVNNLGIYRSENFLTMEDSWWNRQFNVNVMSGVRLSRHVLPDMLAQNWGRILFISSECARLVPDDLIAYSATKAAMEAVSQGLAKLTKGTGVTVNALQPGSTLTEGAAAFLKSQAENQNSTPDAVAADFFKTQRPASTLQRFATVDEVATTIVYFCSPLSAATNGSIIAVDGGSTLGV